MRFLMYVLLLIGYTNAFNYERMLSRQGYSNQGDGYYSRVPKFNGYDHNYVYSECYVIGNDLICSDIAVDCEHYSIHPSLREIYVNGVHKGSSQILNHSTLKEVSGLTRTYEFQDRRFSVESNYEFFVDWDEVAITEDSYEDRVCTENAK